MLNRAENKAATAPTLERGRLYTPAEFAAVNAAHGLIIEPVRDDPFGLDADPARLAAIKARDEATALYEATVPTWESAVRALTEARLKGRGIGYGTTDEQRAAHRDMARLEAELEEAADRKERAHAKVVKANTALQAAHDACMRRYAASLAPPAED